MRDGNRNGFFIVLSLHPYDTPSPYPPRRIQSTRAGTGPNGMSSIMTEAIAERLNEPEQVIKVPNLTESTG
jgi:hypothetical protein